MNIIDDPSPNFGERKDGKKPKYIILHYTGTETLEKALFNLKGGKPDHEVSAHYVIDVKGGVIRLVAEDKRAWHAGKAYWEGEEDINSSSIGIEIQNPGHEYGYVSFTEAQIVAVIELCRDIMARHGILACNVLGHSDVAPDRKEDPGELFPWQRLAAVGIGLWPETSPSALASTTTEETACTLLLNLGYDPKANISTLVTAFQRHYEPEAFQKDAKLGKLTPATLLRLQSLIAKKTALSSCKISSGKNNNSL